jgi:hypothetical protein
MNDGYVCIAIVFIGLIMHGLVSFRPQSNEAKSHDFNTLA